MTYPRIKEFKFDIEKTYSVPSHLVGRLERIAYELFNDFSYYKPLASANNIKLSHGFRVGIRPVEQALRTELQQSNLSDKEVESIVDDKMYNKRSNPLDWYNSSDSSYGYISEVTEGRLLLVPTFASATEYLNLFEFIKGS